MTTLKLVNNLVKDKDKDLLKAQLVLPTISLPLEPVVTPYTLLLDVLKLHRRLSEQALPVVVHLTQLLLQVTNHQAQLEAPAIHLKLEVLLVTHQDRPLNTQAHKVHTQALVLPVLHQQTCHHLRTNLHKVSHHNQTLLTQLPDLPRHRTVTTCHLAEDKLAQATLFLLSSSHSTHKA